MPLHTGKWETDSALTVAVSTLLNLPLVLHFAHRFGLTCTAWLTPGAILSHPWSTRGSTTRRGPRGSYETLLAPWCCAPSTSSWCHILRTRGSSWTPFLRDGLH